MTTWPYGHIHLPKVDNSNIIYSGSLSSCGFDELGEHGMVVGEIHNEYIEVDNANRLKSGLVDYKFVKMDETQFEIINLDVSKFNSTTEAINSLSLKNNIYRIILTGTRNIDVEKLKEEIKATCDNVCDIIDETKLNVDLKEIATVKNLKGIFTKNMLQELEKHPEDEEKIMKAIEYVYNSL